MGNGLCSPNESLGRTKFKYFSVGTTILLKLLAFKTLFKCGTISVTVVVVTCVNIFLKIKNYSNWKKQIHLGNTNTYKKVFLSTFQNNAFALMNICD